MIWVRSYAFQVLLCWLSAVTSMRSPAWFRTATTSCPLLTEADAPPMRPVAPVRDDRSVALHDAPDWESSSR